MKELTIQLESTDQDVSVFYVYSVMFTIDDGLPQELVTYHSREIADRRCKAFKQLEEDNITYFVKPIMVFVR